MKYIARIPLKEIERVQLYVNTGKKTLAQIVRETGAAYALNGGVFDSRFRACCHLRADGYTWAEDAYSYYGYGWDTSDIRVMLSGEKDQVRNYICCVELIRDGKPVEPIYNADMGGVRGRSAMALTQSGELLLWCSRDGSVDAMTPEALRDKLLELGARSAILLDGGGSSQCDFAGEQITSSRVVQNLTLVYLKKGTHQEPEKEDKPVSDDKALVFLDPGHGGSDCANGSPDGTYKEHEFTLDMGRRIRAHLERCGVSVGMTRETDETVSLAERAALANKAGAKLFVSLHSNAGGNTWSKASGLCVYTYAAGGERDELAKAVLQEMRGSGVPIFSAGLYHRKFAVLAQTTMPACLIEYAFHTNKGDVEKLKSAAWRESLAIATARGILDKLGVAWVEPEQSALGTHQEPSGAGLDGERNDGQAGGASPQGGAEQSAPGSDVYRVQVGAFKDKKNAEKLETELKGKGYSTIIKED